MAFHTFTCSGYAVQCFTIPDYLFRVLHSRFVVPCSVYSHSGVPYFTATRAKDTLQERLIQRENFCIQKLKALVPLGLNEELIKTLKISLSSTERLN